MSIVLTWDLFVIVFFTIIIAYSFIIGRNQTLKIIISTYIAILTADGIGNIVGRYISPKVVSIFFPRMDFTTSAIVIKILIFIGVIVVLAMKGEFQVHLSDEHSKMVTLIVNGIFGILSAGLVVSTILFYTSGGSFLQLSGAITNDAILSLKRDSTLVRNLIDYYNLWFSFPAIAFAIASFLKKAEG
jgi:hypothetical protein